MKFNDNRPLPIIGPTDVAYVRFPADTARMGRGTLKCPDSMRRLDAILCGNFLHLRAGGAAGEKTV